MPVLSSPRVAGRKMLRHPPPYEGGPRPAIIRPASIQPARVGRSAPAALKDGGRRAVNVLAAASLILLSAPLMAVVAVLVKLSSPGPVIFVQPRVGLDRRQDGRATRVRDRDVSRRTFDFGGRIFWIYKFRTMRPAAPGEGQVWASPDDPRITRIGHVLRKYRLDELPQLFNVLKGDMNLVGPRPEQPGIFVQLRRRVRGYERRQQVLPGITGWAQVNQAYDQTIEDVQRKVDLDLEYLDRRSAAEDVRIMLRTLPVMVQRKGSM